MVVALPSFPTFFKSHQKCFSAAPSVEDAIFSFSVAGAILFSVVLSLVSVVSFLPHTYVLQGPLSFPHLVGLLLDSFLVLAGPLPPFRGPPRGCHSRISISLFPPPPNIHTVGLKGLSRFFFPPHSCRLYGRSPKGCSSRRFYLPPYLLPRRFGTDPCGMVSGPVTRTFSSQSAFEAVILCSTPSPYRSFPEQL